MIDQLCCPICVHRVYLLEKWKGIYLCTPCRKKYEKIEAIIREGQVLDHQSLNSILRYFGPDEMAKIEESTTVTTKAKRGRPKVDKTTIVSIAPPKRRKRRI
jgi:acetyl-CoA carboxylase beta subunit